MPLLVMKFGGTSVADLDRIKNAARKVQREVERGFQSKPAGSCTEHCASTAQVSTFTKPDTCPKSQIPTVRAITGPTTTMRRSSWPCTSLLTAARPSLTVSYT